MNSHDSLPLRHLRLINTESLSPVGRVVTVKIPLVESQSDEKPETTIMRRFDVLKPTLTTRAIKLLAAYALRADDPPTLWNESVIPIEVDDNGITFWPDIIASEASAFRDIPGVRDVMITQITLGLIKIADEQAGVSQLDVGDNNAG